jgi:hypothetical protein
MYNIFINNNMVRCQHDLSRMKVYHLLLIMPVSCDILPVYGIRQPLLRLIKGGFNGENRKEEDEDGR